MEILELKKRLPRGWSIRLMKKTGLSFDTVSGTMNGRHKNQSVIDAAITLAEESQREQLKRQERIGKLVA